MRIDIHTAKFDLTDGLREHTERRVQFALSWAHANIRKISVRLSDINGPRGGADKSCRIQIPLARGKNIVVEDVEADLYVAIDRATDRAARAMGRELDRMREFSHRKMQFVEKESDETFMAFQRKSHY
jgi:putative sigma-54 modulation protein